MKSDIQIARECLALAGIHLANITINTAAAPCSDDSADSHHTTANAVTWYETGSDSLVLRRGFISHLGVVTEFSKGSQKVLHFGGSWDSSLNERFRSLIWESWNSRP